MRAYNCIIRPAGQVTHEVPRFGISAKEVVMLRHVHGRDGVIKIEDVGEFEQYDERKDYDRMAFNYGPEMVHRVFGVFVEDFDETDPDKGKKFINDFRIIEEDAKSADVKSVLEEAGAKGDAPQSRTETGPMVVGDSESKHAAQEVAKSLE